MILSIETLCPTIEEADRIAAALLESRLIACANRGGEVTSLFRWEGAVQKGKEILLSVKTRTDLGDRVEEAIRALHSYALPPILRHTLTANGDYEAWVAEETADA